jgi:protein involved in polysaccharide export with SLBB domain
LIRGLLLSLLITGFASADLAAQQRREVPDTTERLPRAQATRADLQQELAAERSGPNRERRVMALQRRLEDGDIQVGDRIYVEVEGETEAGLVDTFTVRAGRTLDMPNIPPIPLAGLLRSEVPAKVQEAVSRYIREPVIYVEPLMRVAVLGEVGSPGYYTVPADAPLPDVVMLAGGPTGAAALDKTEVRRTGTVIRTRDDMSQALAAGTSLDQMNLHSGDEIVIGEKGSGLMKTLQYIAPLTGLVYLVTRIF